VAAVGVQGGIGEQEILLYVQYRDGRTTGFAELAAWAEPLLARFQQPRYYREVAHFEMTPSERVQKHLLPRDANGAWDRLRAR
jgi:crotonobetaine/carnitine-CoA ligase